VQRSSGKDRSADVCEGEMRKRCRGIQPRRGDCDHDGGMWWLKCGTERWASIGEIKRRGDEHKTDVYEAISRAPLYSLALNRVGYLQILQRYANKTNDD
jgi:hypothetical protein